MAEKEFQPTEVKVKFMGYDCITRTTFDGYVGTGNTAIELVDEHTGEEVATATVNLRQKQRADHVAIKDYSFNEGMLEALREAGVVGEELYSMPSGFVEIPVVKYLLPTPESK